MILCCGEALIDMIPQTDGALQPRAGGASLNTAVALGNLGVAVGLFAGVSNDPMGQVVRAALRDGGVDLSFLVTGSRPSTLAVVSLDQGTPRYSFYDENSAGRMLAQADIPQLPDPVEALLFGGISLCNPPAADSFVALAERAGERVVMLDPNIRPALIPDAAAYRARLHRILSLADIVKVSDEDLEWLYPDAPDLTARLAELQQVTAALVLCTRGPGAVIVRKAGNEIAVPVHAVPVTDTVGAGDAFNAGVLAFLAQNRLLGKKRLAGLEPEQFRAVVSSGIARAGELLSGRVSVLQQPVLVADIGGTNTRIGMARGGVVDTATVRRFANEGIAGFETLLAQYRAEFPASVATCCIAVAGPVKDGQARMTNLDWLIDPQNISAVTGAAQTVMINDLAALGYGLAAFDDAVLTPVLTGATQNDGARMVVGVGTGFNVAVVHGDEAPLVFASESGHMALPVRDMEMLQLAQFAAGPDGFSSLEDVLSGRGLETVYRWEAERRGVTRTPDAPEICAAVAAGNDPVAERAMARFVVLLGGVIGDLALSHLPFGGIFLAGSVARGVAPFLDRFGFEPAFRDKGCKSGLMQAFSLSLINEDSAALTGCALGLVANNTEMRNKTCPPLTILSLSYKGI